MNSPFPGAPKSRGRPKTTGRGTGIMVRCHEEQLGALDAWIADQPDPKPSRPEAIREALAEHLTAKGYLK
ncbi:CopG family transcriptional regulator [Methylobacterium currus]|uniref:CopG family transcriptional regulator n=1 Tax=Methylobacterium currus TaxID=2051553 RepID=A0A2R4WHD2_9HYPH|nr:CopG family transcriptional regulator [Methylobacterium currus]